MKWSGRYYLILLLPLLFTGCALQLGQQQSPAERLVSIYRIPALLAQAAPAATESLNRNLPSSASASTRKRLDHLLSRKFAPAKLHADVIHRLQKKADAAGRNDDLRRAANWLDEPLARHMIALERNIDQPGFLQAFKQFADQKADSRRKQRLLIVRGLADNLQLAQLQTDFNVTLLSAMIRTRNIALTATQKVDNSQIQQTLSDTRHDLLNKLKQRLPLMLLYVYRDVATAKLKHYAALQSRSAMAWANHAIAQSVADALKAASRRIPKNHAPEN